MGYVKTLNITIEQLPFGKELRNIYNGILHRCYHRTNTEYECYGGRGIKVCDEWKNDFMAFYKWAILQGYCFEEMPSGRNKWSIDRINNDGNYEPSNCRWATAHQQRINQRPHGKKIKVKYEHYQSTLKSKYPSDNSPHIKQLKLNITRVAICDEKGTHIITK